MCDDAKAVLEKVRQQLPFSFREFKLTPGDAYWEEYREMFPVVHIDKVQAFKYRVNEQMLKIKLQQLMIEKTNKLDGIEEEHDEGEIVR